VALTAGGDRLVVDDFGKGQSAGHEGKSGFGLSVLCGVEAGEADVEMRFEGSPVGLGDFGKRYRSPVVVAQGELGLAQGEQRGRVVRCFLNGHLQPLDSFLRCGCVGAADVVFKGAEFDAARSGEKCLLGYIEVGIDLPCDLPGDGVLDVEEAREFAGVLQGLGQAELVDLEDLSLYGDAPTADGVAAYDDEVGVECLGDADGGCARGAEVNGKAEVVESILPVVAGDGEEPYRGEALVECIGEGLADPGEVGLVGAIVEGENKDNSAAGLVRFSG
jgi:hypothetical protein